MAYKDQIEKGKRVFSPRTAEVVAAEEKTTNRPYRAGDDVLLQKIPFAVLLPTIGESSHLQQMKESIHHRHDFLKVESENQTDQNEAALAAEIGMLAQTLQWLDEL